MKVLVGMAVSYEQGHPVHVQPAANMLKQPHFSTRVDAGDITRWTTRPVVKVNSLKEDCLKGLI